MATCEDRQVWLGCSALGGLCLSASGEFSQPLASRSAARRPGGRRGMLAICRIVKDAAAAAAAVAAAAVLAPLLH